MTEKEPLFLLIGRLATKDDAAPLNKFDGCWERQIGKEWWIALNGHKEPIKCSRGFEVPPFNCYAEFNGWPAALFDPFNGMFCAGELGNEDNFATAVEREISA